MIGTVAGGLQMESHDVDRVASKYGAEMVQVFTALKLALPGVDITYYGSELGMENTYVRDDEIQDAYDSAGRRNVGSRDFARSPMQWNGETNAGDDQAANNITPDRPVSPALNIKHRRSTFGDLTPSFIYIFSSANAFPGQIRKCFGRTRRVYRHFSTSKTRRRRRGLAVFS